MKEELFVILACIIIIVLICFGYYKFNSTEHSDDIEMTEWVSPDGVHYWYYQNDYQGYLAPRYDSNGELVIDGE